jgi:hypothetical protein
MQMKEIEQKLVHRRAHLKKHVEPEARQDHWLTQRVNWLNVRPAKMIAVEMQQDHWTRGELLNLYWQHWSPNWQSLECESLHPPELVLSDWEIPQAPQTRPLQMKLEVEEQVSFYLPLSTCQT